jgi:SH3-like domain-containing protein
MSSVGRSHKLASGIHAAFTIAAVLLAGVTEVRANEVAAGPVSGLPLPRFVSLKPDKVNVRAGPTRTHDVTFQYTRAGLPVEITAESDNWRRIRDWDGSEGWVYHAMLSGRRTAVVRPAKKDDAVPLHTSADASSAMIASLKAGVLGNVRRCNGAWCRIVGAGFDGYIAQDRLWGVYPGEKFD